MVKLGQVLQERLRTSHHCHHCHLGACRRTGPLQVLRELQQGWSPLELELGQQVRQGLQVP